MSVIRRLAPEACPECRAKNSLYLAAEGVLCCKLCGYNARKQEAAPVGQAASNEDLRERYTVTYRTPHSADLSPWARSKFDSAMDYTHRKKYEQALDVLRKLVDSEPDFVDAHLWLARLSLEPDEKRKHYGFVLAYVPNQLEAVRELMVLKGEMSRADADRSLDERGNATVEAMAPVETELVEIVCPNCRGKLTAKPDQSEVTCWHCGHEVAIDIKQDYGFESLTMALLKERAKGVEWRVGQFLLHCDNCGADRIMTGRKLTTQCPFCGSNHVLRKDALNSFRQPDAIVPFALKREAADAALDDALSSFTERVKNIFSNNRAEQIHLEPVYVPYWLFDVTAEITKTIQPNESVKGRVRSYQDLQRHIQRETFSDVLLNVHYCGVESPPRKLIERLPKFDTAQVVPYDPKRLANLSAELYSVDFQQASLKVRKRIGDEFRFIHGYSADSDVTVRVSHIIQHMSFRLVLMPLWVATITEADGDRRLALIHGQDGKVIFGRAIAPD